MKRITVLTVFLVGSLVILTAAFLLLDFRLMRPHMAADSESQTFAFNTSNDERLLPMAQDLVLYVQAPPGLKENLVAALSEELQTNPYVRDITVQEEPPVAAEDTVLVVSVGEPAVLFWTPFYARSVIPAQAAYASDGEVDWADEAPVVLASTETPQGPVLRVLTTHEFKGNAYGLISRPGYATYLADELATQINGSLANTLATAGS